MRHENFYRDLLTVVLLETEIDQKRGNQVSRYCLCQTNVVKLDCFLVHFLSHDCNLLASFSLHVHWVRGLYNQPPSVLGTCDVDVLVICPPQR